MTSIPTSLMRSRMVCDGHVADVRDELQLEVGRALAPGARAQVRRDVLPLEVEGPMHGGGGLEDLGDRGMPVSLVGLAREERGVALDLDEVEAGGGIDHLVEHPRGVDLGVRETHPMGAHVLGVATDVGDQQDGTAGFHAQGSHLSARGFSMSPNGVTIGRRRLLERLLRLVAVEPVVDDRRRLLGARRVPEDDGEEPVGTQRLQLERRSSPRRWPFGACGGAARSRRSPPGAERGHDPSVAHHVGLARLDHVVAVADVTLGEHRVHRRGR